MAKTYKHIVFDIDGTLVDNEKAVLLTWQEALENLLEKRYELDELEFVLGAPGVTTMERLGIENPEKAFQYWGKIFLNHRDSIVLFDGIVTLIETLKQQGVTLGIVTSRLHSELNNDDALGKIIDHFSTIICVTDAPRPKPNADPLLAYMERENALPSDVVYIGDSNYDRQCADNAGVDFVRALWGKSSAQINSDEKSATTPADILSMI